MTDTQILVYVDLDGVPVLILRRFDRTVSACTPFLSALSMLGAEDHETRSYLELVDVLRRYGAAPKEDMREMWRRIVFSILISNTDDHLRNHAFLYEGPEGWHLAPAYDLNPVPVDIKPRVLATAIDLEDGTPCSDQKTDLYWGRNSDQGDDLRCPRPFTSPKISSPLLSSRPTPAESSGASESTAARW